jgi:YcaO-like protein with predicted kinase domain
MPAARKAYRAGTHRTVHPEETLERALRWAPIMGITRIANVTGLDCLGVPVVMVCRPNSRSIAVSQGKGLTLAAAKASGLMESVECYHAETITLPLRYCTYEELRYTHGVVDVTLLPTIATSNFHPNLKLLWIEGHDLLNDEDVYVPYEVVHTDYTWPPPAGSGCFSSSSNGLASGNHRLEAISHAICEVVERDSTSLWRLRDPSELGSRGLDLATVDDAACRSILERFESAGLTVAVWDTTTDVGIASFLCVAFRRDDDPTRRLPPSPGAGCHPFRAIALLRALTEAAQARLTQISGSRDDVTRDTYAHHRYGGAVEVLRDQAGGRRDRRFDDVPDAQSDTLDGDVRWELERLRAAGITQVIAVDLTKEIFQLPVVRVVIPGLEGMHEVPGYVPGRRARAVAGARA